MPSLVRVERREVVDLAGDGLGVRVHDRRVVDRGDAERVEAVLEQFPGHPNP